MNPAGKSVVCILHEFVQHTERTQPKYIFQELGQFFLFVIWIEANFLFDKTLENVNKPYSATVVINDMEYGKGYGSSKKEAKTEAGKYFYREMEYYLLLIAFWFKQKPVSKFWFRTLLRNKNQKKTIPTWMTWV